MKVRIPLATLPKTYLDAVTLVRRFNCRYLWVDSICIVQDDPFDSQTEASQMASIYRNSSLTIAAAKAKNDDDGPFSEINEQPKALELGSYAIPFPVYVRYQRDEAQYIMGLLDWPKKRDHPLSERAWVFQERVLSPRIVFFGHNEVARGCTSALACQCDPTMRHYKDDHISVVACQDSHLKASFSLPLKYAQRATSRLQSCGTS